MTAVSGRTGIGDGAETEAEPVSDTGADDTGAYAASHTVPHHLKLPCLLPLHPQDGLNGIMIGRISSVLVAVVDGGLKCPEFP